MNKILIADDNKQITSILAGYARKEGLEPVIALDGKEALDAFAKYGDEIVMILLDVMMPEVDGFEVCRRLRRESMVPIIMVTARGEDYDIFLNRFQPMKLWPGCVQYCAAFRYRNSRSRIFIRRAVYLLI